MNELALQITNFVQNINVACFCKVDYSTPNHGLLKTSKVDGSINPLWSRKNDIRKVVEGSQINLGVVYENAANGRILKHTDLEPDFKSRAMYGKVAHSSGHKNLCQSTDGSKVYIRYMPMNNKTITVRYELDGKDVTDQMWKYRSPSKQTPSTQAAKGLDDSNSIQWRTLDVSRITRFEGAGAVIN